MNVLGLSLMLTSLAVAGVFSPSPSPNSNTIVKDGHRVVVVEYDQDGYHNNKISISPPQQPHQDDDIVTNVIDNKHKIKEAASVVQGGSGSHHDHYATTFLHSPKELICDAYGMCKHKIADAMGIAKDKISETAHEAIHMEKDMIHSKKETARVAKETVADAVGKAKETVYNTAHDVQQQTKESVDKAKEKGQTLKEHVVRNVSEAKDSLGNAVKHATTNIAGSMETLMGVANLLGFATAYGMNVWVTFISSYVLSRAMPRKPFGVVQSKIYPVYFRAMAYSIGIALLGHVLSHRKRLFLTISMPQIFQAYNLLASLSIVFINSLYLEPCATKLMLERMKIEKEEGRGREDMMKIEKEEGRGREDMMSGEHSSSRIQEHHHHNTSTDPKETTTTTTTIRGAEHDAVRSRIMKLNEKINRLNSHSCILNFLNLMSLTCHLVYLAQRLHLTC